MALNLLNINYEYYKGDLDKYIIKTTDENDAFLIKNNQNKKNKFIKLKEIVKKNQSIEEPIKISDFIDTSKKSEITRQFSTDTRRSWPIKLFDENNNLITDNITNGIQSNNSNFNNVHKKYFINKNINKETLLKIMYFGQQAIFPNILNYIYSVLYLYIFDLIKNGKILSLSQINEILNNAKNMLAINAHNKLISKHNGLIITSNIQNNPLLSYTNELIVSDDIIHKMSSYHSITLYNNSHSSNIGHIKININNYINTNESNISINFMSIFNEIYYVYYTNFSKFFLPNTVIPIKKNKVINSNKTDYKDFMLIDFNEANKKYTLKDCIPILYKVMKQLPCFIVVCTQESLTKSEYEATHYQHVLKKELLNLNYKMLIKEESSINKINKNVRTRIYYNNNIVDFIPKKQLNNNIFNELLNYTIYQPDILNNNYITPNNITPNNKKNINKSISNHINSENINTKNNLKGLITKSFKDKFYITDFGKKKFKSSSYNGSICMRLEFIEKINDKYHQHKYIFVNSYLYHNKTDNLKKRINLLEDLVREFKLVDFWLKGYNIFLCGDLNFKLYSFKNTNNPSDPKFNTLPKKIIKNYINNNSLFKTDFFEIYKDNDELYKILKLLSESTIRNTVYSLNNQNQNVYNLYNSFSKSFYDALLNSYELLGLNLTSKYFQNQGDKNYSFYEKRAINNYNKIFDIKPSNKSFLSKEGGNSTFFGTKQKTNPVIPSNPNSTKGSKFTFFKTKTKEYPIIPSNSDRILFALNKDTIIDPFYYDIQIFPDKSSHKMITLSFNLSNKNINSVTSNNSTKILIDNNFEITNVTNSENSNNINNNRTSRLSYSSNNNSISTKSIPTKSIPTNSIPTNSIPNKSIPNKSIPNKSIPTNSIPNKQLNNNFGIEIENVTNNNNKKVNRE